jgi:hypothetical protein
MTDAGPERRAIAFEGARCLASGALADVARAVKAAHDRGAREPVLVFDAESSAPIEIDVRGTPEEVVARLAPATVEPEARRGPGRPKLGVVAREVTLLPRHWEWLATQPGGASVALRRLVEDARRASGGRDRVRVARETAYRFMSALAGDEAGYEEATRALFAGDRARFETHVAAWPPDVRAHAITLASTAFDAETEGHA